MIDILNKLREFEQPVTEATITTQQIEAFKKWHEKYSKMKTRDVYNYAEGIFKAHMETGDTELDGYSRQDPEGKAYDELNAIFPSMKAEVEEIGNALRAKGIDPFSGEKFSESEQPVAELDDKQRTASSLKYSSDPRVAYFDKMMKRYGPKLMELIIDHSHIISTDEKKGEEKLKKYGQTEIDFMNRFNHLDGVEEDFTYMLMTAVEKGEEGLIDFFYDRVEQAKKAGDFSKTSSIPDPDEYEESVAEAEFKRIATDKAEKARLHARLKDLKAKYNAQMAGQGDGNPEDTEEEIEKLEKELGMSQESVQEAKPDFLDLDKDGDKTEPMAKAAKDKEMKKETVQEAITMTAETPQEASVLMQILKLAGIEPKPVDDKMINPAEQEGCGCDDNCSCGGNCGADCDCENCGKAEETYANEPNTSVKGIDAITNKGSDDLHRAKGAYVKAAGGDNPMAIGENELSEEELSNSLRAQYESFKQAYQTEASKAKNPYAIGMAQAMKSTGDTPPLEKSTITKAHDIAKAVEKGK